MDTQLDNIMKLQPKKFNWILDNTLSNGFIAQEVGHIYPDMLVDFTKSYCCDNTDFDVNCPCDASGNEWYYGLDYSSFTPYIIKAFQEYKTQTDDLINNLINRIENLEQKNNV